MAIKDRLIGVIDIGSNSVRLVIFEVYGVAATPIFNEKLLAGLGRDMRTTGKLYAEGAAQTLKALHRFAALAKSYQLDDLKVVATAAMREASDGRAFIARVKRETGLKVRVLSGEEEGFMSALGVHTADRRSRGIVADLGGSSLELIHLGGGVAEKGRTFKLGPLAVMDADYNPAKLRKTIRKALKPHAEDYAAAGKTLYLVGGAWRNLALIHNERVSYPLKILHNFALGPQEAQAVGHWAGEIAHKELLNWPGISSRRAETLPYAGLVMDELIKLLKPKRVVFSTAGLREGLLYDSLPKSVKSRVPLFDAARHLAHGNEQGTNFGPSVYDFLSPAAPYLPAAFEPENEERLRRAGCLLVGIGKGLHPDHRANLVFSDVLYAPLAGLTHKERAYLAQMLFASYTSQAETPNEPALNYHLLSSERNAARCFGAALRLASVISARSPDLLKAFELSCDGQTLTLNVKPDYRALLNRRGVLRLQNLASLAGMAAQSNWEAATDQDFGEDEDKAA